MPFCPAPKTSFLLFAQGHADEMLPLLHSSRDGTTEAQEESPCPFIVPAQADNPISFHTLHWEWCCAADSSLINAKNECLLIVPEVSRKMCLPTPIGMYIIP